MNDYMTLGFLFGCIFSGVLYLAILYFGTRR